MEVPRERRWWRRVLGWLTAGRPAGMPRTDYVPIFGLLRHELTDAEAREVAGLCAVEAQRERRPVTDADIRRTVDEVVYQHADEHDVAAVRRVLEDAGYPCAPPAGSTRTTPG